MRKLIRLLKDAWNWIVGLFTGRPPDKGPPLRKITNIQVEIDMANVILNWDTPTERTDGSAAEPANFETRIGLRVAGAANFTPLQVVPGTDPSTITLQNQAGGDYEFSLVLHDLLLDRSQTPITQQFSVPIADLNPITNVTVTIE